MIGYLTPVYRGGFGLLNVAPPMGTGGETEVAKEGLELNPRDYPNGGVFHKILKDI